MLRLIIVLIVCIFIYFIYSEFKKWREVIEAEEQNELSKIKNMKIGIKGCTVVQDAENRAMEEEIKSCEDTENEK